MQHLEQIKVAFWGAVSRQVIENNVIKKYYRIAFTHPVDKKTYHITSVDDISGKAGVVMFVKGGETGPNGNKIVKDAFTLLGAADATTAVNAKNALDSI
jgi:hypothetical protein